MTALRVRRNANKLTNAQKCDLLQAFKKYKADTSTNGFWAAGETMKKFAVKHSVCDFRNSTVPEHAAVLCVSRSEGLHDLDITTNANCLTKNANQFRDPELPPMPTVSQKITIDCHHSSTVS